MPTINDVARRAGVSPVTVSRVINETGNVSATTQAKVEQAINELGYVPSAMARSLRSKRTRTLALIVSDVTNPFWTTVARGVEDAAQDRGYSVFLYNTDENPAKQQRYLDVVVAQGVDGVMIAPYDSDARNLAKLRRRNLPTVTVDRRIQGWDVDSVYCDSLSGAKALTRHLIDLGHRRIALISGPVSTSTAADRVAGYCVALTEAGMPVDPRLIKQGEYRATSGEELTNQVLDEGLSPTAIFAANNTIAVGVIQALGKHGLRVPQDIALVCFDDLPDVSRLFPFLTVVTQPAYDMGMNAVQLLLSRLDGEVGLRSRRVVLPTRLIVRYSCGSRLRGQSGPGPSLPLLADVQFQSILVKPLGPEEAYDSRACFDGVTLAAPAEHARLGGYDAPKVERLLHVLQHQEADRVPYLEFQVTSKAVFEYVLGRKPEYDVADTWDARVSGLAVAPEDHVEFALRLGMDVVPCDFSWRPNNVFAQASDGSWQYIGGTLKTWADLDDVEQPPSLASQLSFLERYLHAAQGTGVGVFANFTSFFDSAMLAVGVADSLYMFYDDRAFLEKLMDIILAHQEKVMRAVCDRFGNELAFVLVNDDVAHNIGLMIHPDMFIGIFPRRMERLIAPAKAHGKLVAMHTSGKMDQVLPILRDVGFDAVHPLTPECNDIVGIKKRWGEEMALMGGIPTALLAYGSMDEIEQRVREYCVELAPGGGYVLGSSAGIIAGVPPENVVAMTQAAHRYGGYRSLGVEA